MQALIKACHWRRTRPAYKRMNLNNSGPAVSINRLWEKHFIRRRMKRESPLAALSRLYQKIRIPALPVLWLALSEGSPRSVCHHCVCFGSSPHINLSAFTSDRINPIPRCGYFSLM